MVPYYIGDPKRDPHLEVTHMSNVLCGIVESCCLGCSVLCYTGVCRVSLVVEGVLHFRIESTRDSQTRKPATPSIQSRPSPLQVSEKTSGRSQAPPAWDFGTRCFFFFFFLGGLI